MDEKTLQSKKEMAARLYKKHQKLVRCPICSAEVTANKECLKCKNNHTFNISKKGVVALQRKTNYYASDIYTKELFEARKYLILSGVYDKLHTEIANIISSRFSSPTIIDIGSGEGSHLKGIINSCDSTSGAIALDISKPAIELASCYLEDGILPLVADSNNLPFMDGTIDVALDILSPLLISETLRALKDGGIIIKVIPCENYLKEIREAVGIREYTKNEEVLNNIKQKLTVIDSKKLQYSVSLTKEQSDNLIKMTPMTSGVKAEGVVLQGVTIDLMIIIATK